MRNGLWGELSFSFAKFDGFGHCTKPSETHPALGVGSNHSGHSRYIHHYSQICCRMMSALCSIETSIQNKAPLPLPLQQFGLCVRTVTSVPRSYHIPCRRPSPSKSFGRLFIARVNQISRSLDPRIPEDINILINIGIKVPPVGL